MKRFLECAKVMIFQYINEATDKAFISENGGFHLQAMVYFNWNAPFLAPWP